MARSAASDERLWNLAVAVRVAGLLEDARAAEQRDPNAAERLYLAALEQEAARRAAARRAGTFAEHEIETGTADEIEERLRQLRRE